MAICRAGFCAGTSLTIFLLTDYKPIGRFGLFLAGIAGEKWSPWVLALPFLGRIYHKFLFADDPFRIGDSFRAISQKPVSG